MNSTHIDLIIRIKNGYLAGKDSIVGPYSKLNENILAILKKKEYIADFAVEEDNNKKSFIIELMYDDRIPAVQDIKISSKPGRRDYVGVRDIESVLGGLGLSVISTSKGLMTDSEARENKMGGELLFSIW